MCNGRAAADPERKLGLRSPMMGCMVRGGANAPALHDDMTSLSNPPPLCAPAFVLQAAGWTSSLTLSVAVFGLVYVSKG